MSHTKCYYCGVEHPRVEGGGLRWCPNPLCYGPGAVSHKSKLKSYAEGPTHYTFDDEECLWAGIAMIPSADPVLAAAIKERARVICREHNIQLL